MKLVVTAELFDRCAACAREAYNDKLQSRAGSDSGFKIQSAGERRVKVIVPERATETVWKQWQTAHRISTRGGHPDISPSSIEVEFLVHGGRLQKPLLCVLQLSDGRSVMLTNDILKRDVRNSVSRVPLSDVLSRASPVNKDLVLRATNRALKVCNSAAKRGEQQNEFITERGTVLEVQLNEDEDEVWHKWATESGIKVKPTHVYITVNFAMDRPEEQEPLRDCLVELRFDDGSLEFRLDAEGRVIE